MSICRICSEYEEVRGTRYGARTPYFVLPTFWLAALVLALFAAPAAAQEVLTQAEALRIAFPDATSIDRRTAFLGEKELAGVRTLAGPGVEVRQGVVTYYVGIKAGRPLGAAYFDVHRVRTLPEVLMIVVSPDARVERIEVLKFSEPPEYRAPEGWIRQFHGKPLAPDLSLKGSIRNLTGATLTSDAVTDAARRVLSLHRVIDPFARGATR